MKHVLVGLIERQWNAARQFGSWWVGELLELWRMTLTRIAPRLVTRLVACPGDSELRVHVGPKGEGPLLWHCSLTEQPAAGEHRPTLDTVQASYGNYALLVMPEREVLRYRFTLPGTVDRHLDSAVMLYIERELPMPLEHVCVHYQLGRSSEKQNGVTVEAYIARRDRVEYHRARIEALGFQVTRVSVLDQTGRIVGNFLPRRIEGAWPIWTRTDRKLTIAVAILCLISIASTIGRWTHERIVVEREISELQASNVHATRLLEELADVSAQAAVLSREMREPDAIDLLEIVTASIPGDAWTYELELHAPPAVPGTLSLRGFASANVDLQSALQVQPGFSRIQMTTLQDAGAGGLGSHFDLKAEWDGMTGPSSSSQDPGTPGAAP